jgi:hypothetical protein
MHMERERKRERENLGEINNSITLLHSGYLRFSKH